MIGIDEVGRGCLAGPLLVVAAREKTNLKLNLVDSKTISRQTRERLISTIKIYYDLGEGWIGPDEIDNLGLTVAMKVAVEKALLSLGTDVNENIIIDGSINYCHNRFINSTAVIKADSTVQAVSAASIYAKVIRDNYMKSVALKYPLYGFESNVGYGTKFHIEALSKHGVTDIHRRSYKIVKKYL